MIALTFDYREYVSRLVLRTSLILKNTFKCKLCSGCQMFWYVFSHGPVILSSVLVFNNNNYNLIVRQRRYSFASYEY